MEYNEYQTWSILIRRFRLISDLLNIYITTNLVNKELTWQAQLIWEHHAGRFYERYHTTSKGTYPIHMFTKYALLGLFLSWIPILKEYQSYSTTLILDALPHPKRVSVYWFTSILDFMILKNFQCHILIQSS